MQAQREEAGDELTATGVSDAEGAAHHQRRVTSFRSRHASLSGGQERTWEQRWPEIGAEARDAAGKPAVLDLDRWFGRQAPLVLEIGCGTGISTAIMAQQEPELDVIAVEVYRKGLAQLLSAIDRNGIGNIRLIRGDGLDVLEHVVGSASLTGVRVFFPDPWPKARHHKRRLLQPETMALIADRLKPGGIMHAATDHADYAEQIAEVGEGEPALRPVDPTATLPISVQRPVTKYEGKGRDAGRVISEFVWERQ